MMNSPTPEDPNEPYPSIGAALLLTMMAFIASIFTGIALYGIGPLAAYGIGRAIGVGSVATMAAGRIGEPQARRLGLMKLDAEAIPLILCLIPAMLLMSELDNFAYDYAGDEPTLIEQFESTSGADTPGSDLSGDDAYNDAGDDSPEARAERFDQASRGSEAREDATPEEQAQFFDPEDPASLIQAFIVMVGIIPLVDCFLFFGVIQQGLVRRYGLLGGVMITALLWMLMRQVPVSGVTQFLTATTALVGLGILLGLCRVATGSILAPMMLASGWAGIEFLALATLESSPLRGLNVPGTHLPLLVSTASAGIVAWASWTLFGEARRRFDDEPPDPRPSGRPPIKWTRRDLDL